jgi:benzoyl-CoA reductase subunit BamC
MACSGLHATPEYSSFNPARSRIRVVLDLLNDVYLPVRGGDFAASECSGRHSFIIKGKQYSECSFCSVSCPSHGRFREPDSSLPLKCDMCEQAAPNSPPLCVQVCRPGALSYEERVEEPARVQAPGRLDDGIESLVRRHGVEQVQDAATRLSRRR